MTYGDGVADVDINASIAFHQKSGTLATLQACCPKAVLRDGHGGERITSFREKTKPTWAG